MSVDIEKIVVQTEDFDVQSLYQGLLKSNQTGAVVMFVGLVRHLYPAGEGEYTLELEHYAGMTEHNLQRIVAQAQARWPLLAVNVTHRIGRLEPQDQIVFVGVSAKHRSEAFAACDFIMDYLKNQAAFWKKENHGASSQWVRANPLDELRLQRWQSNLVD